MYKASFCVGRFNPITKAHGEIIDRMISDDNDNDIFIFVVDGEQSSRNKDKNPLGISRRLSVFRNIYPRWINNKRVIIESVSNMFECFDVLDVMGYMDLLLYCGTDRLATYRKIVNSYNIRCDVICQDRNDNVSATAVREAVRSNNLELAKSLLHPNINDDDIENIFKDIKCQT